MEKEEKKTNMKESTTTMNAMQQTLIVGLPINHKMV